MRVTMHPGTCDYCKWPGPLMHMQSASFYTGWVDECPQCGLRVGSKPTPKRTLYDAHVSSVPYVMRRYSKRESDAVNPTDRVLAYLVTLAIVGNLVLLARRTYRWIMA